MAGSSTTYFTFLLFVIQTCTLWRAARWAAPARRVATSLLFVVLGLLLPGRGQAQPTAWQAALASGSTASSTGIARVQATTTDASGSVYVAGYFSGTVGFGPSTLVSAGSDDAFVARWNPATGGWAWALAGGGIGTDQALGVAVSDGAVYVAGSIQNDNAGTNGSRDVQFGTLPLPGASSSAGYDVFVARVTDPGTAAPTDWAWALAAGGSNSDQAAGVAVNGSAVYVTGFIQNDNADTNGSRDVQFGTVPLPGSSTSNNNDVFVTRLTDPGTAAPTDWAWALAGGGTFMDQGRGVAVRGDAVYVTGYIQNNNADTNGTADVQFGTVPLPGASSSTSFDIFVARVTDPGTSAPTTWAWALAGGGIGNDQAYGLAVRGSTVAVAGFVVPAVTLGPTTIAGPVGTQTAFGGDGGRRAAPARDADGLHGHDRGHQRPPALGYGLGNQQPPLRGAAQRRWPYLAPAGPGGRCRAQRHPARLLLCRYRRARRPALLPPTPARPGRHGRSLAGAHRGAGRRPGPYGLPHACPGRAAGAGGRGPGRPALTRGAPRVEGRYAAGGGGGTRRPDR